MIMGDFNAKVGNGTSGKTIGPFGLGKRNERGDRLIHWCEEKRLAVMNTWFDVHPRHRYTWVSPGDRARNQIDYILFSKRYRSAVSKVKMYPGADANSDIMFQLLRRSNYTLIKDAQNIKTHTKVLYKCS